MAFRRTDPRVEIACWAGAKPLWFPELQASVPPRYLPYCHFLSQDDFEAVRDHADYLGGRSWVDHLGLDGHATGTATVRRSRKARAQIRNVASDLGFPGGAGEGNRTPTVSLGRRAEIRANQYTC